MRQKTRMTVRKKGLDLNDILDLRYIELEHVLDARLQCDGRRRASRA